MGSGHMWISFPIQDRLEQPGANSCLLLVMPPQGTSFNLKYLSRFTCHSPLTNLKTKIPFKTQVFFRGTLPCLLLLLAQSTWCCTLVSLHQAPTGIFFKTRFVFPLIPPNTRSQATSSFYGFEQLLPSVVSSNFLLLWFRATSSFCGRATSFAKSEYCNIVGSLRSV